MSLRGTLSAISMALLAPAVIAQQDAKSAIPKVVFVCEHGAAKSVIAAKELEKLARERGIPVQAVSRGSEPQEEIGATVRDGLKAEGIDIGDLKPVGVKAADLRDATMVISFGPDLSAIAGNRIKVQDWSATPAVSDGYETARNDIVKRLHVLLDQFARAKH